MSFPIVLLFVLETVKAYVHGGIQAFRGTLALPQCSISRFHSPTEEFGLI